MNTKWRTTSVQIDPLLLWEILIGCFRFTSLLSLPWLGQQLALLASRVLAGPLVSFCSGRFDSSLSTLVKKLSLVSHLEEFTIPWRKVNGIHMPNLKRSAPKGRLLWNTISAWVRHTRASPLASLNCLYMFRVRIAQLSSLTYLKHCTKVTTMNNFVAKIVT